MIIENEGILTDGKVLFIKAFNHILQPIMDFEGLMITLEIKKFTDYIWYYDMETLIPLYYNFTNKNHKRIEGTLQLLNEIGNKDSIEPLYKLTFHENHTIRWKSLQSLINLDFEKGIEILKRMTNDQHPEVRIAAQNSLSRLLKI